MTSCCVLCAARWLYRGTPRCHGAVSAVVLSAGAAHSRNMTRARTILIHLFDRLRDFVLFVANARVPMVRRV